MQKKKDRITSIVTLGLFLVFIGALIYQTLPEKKTKDYVSQDPFLESVETVLTNDSPLEELPVDEKWMDETESPNEPNSFDDAFAAARAVLGKGNTFFWNGNEYTTNLAEEVSDESLLADSTLNSKNDFRKNQTAEVPAVSQVITVK